MKKEKTGPGPVFFLCRNKMKKMQWKGPVFLALAAFFWGTTFVAQDLSSDFVKPFTFNSLRMILGALFLLPVILVKNKGRFFATCPKKEDKKHLLLSSALCSLVLLVAANLQQFGISLGTGAGKSGFITAMYVVLVPVLGIFLKKKIRPILWLCVLFSVFGLYLLCMASFSEGISGVLNNLSMSKGDLVTLGCALFYTFHIMVIDSTASETDGVMLSFFQFLFAGIMGLILALVFEQPQLTHIALGAGGILYSAFFSCAVAYTLQILGQQCTPAVIASILMCMESVFAVLSDMVVLKTVLTTEEIIGCIFMFVAILGSSLSDFLPQKKK